MPAPGANAYRVNRSVSGRSSAVVLSDAVVDPEFTDPDALSGRTNAYQLTAINDCGVGYNAASTNVLAPSPALVFAAKSGYLSFLVRSISA